MNDAMKPRYFVHIAYNGNKYHGWQIQKSHVSVQQTLNEHISTMLGEKILCHGCGRTDAGVHARKYYFHFDTSSNLNNQFFYKLNAFLPKDIRIIQAFIPTPRIHARWDALKRSYEYLVCTVKDPFMDGFAFLTNDTFDIELMNNACQVLMEYNDFESFSKSNNGLKHYLCDIFDAGWVERDDLLIFRISANRFVRSMVRMIVGTMLDVGRKKITLQEFRAVIESKDRNNAGAVVPACGLYFTDVVYPEGVLIPLEN
jgi:tRNA pseudouridine38-40 synthase